jgi:hypothetical protein
LPSHSRNVWLVASHACRRNLIGKKPVCVGDHQTERSANIQQVAAPPAGKIISQCAARRIGKKQREIPAGVDDPAELRHFICNRANSLIGWLVIDPWKDSVTPLRGHFFELRSRK